MIHQYTLDIRPNGPDLEINVKGKDLPLAGRVFARVSPVLSPSQIDIFRTGASKPKEMEDLGKCVSDWLLGPDLKALVEQWTNGADRLRLVFSVDSRVQLTLNDLPFELIRTDLGQDPVVIQPQVDNFVYLLPSVGAAASTKTLDWPMRVLVVRANPADLGGGVPEAMPIRQRILELGERHFAPGMVQVDLLSSEPAAGASGPLGPPTWESFKKTARSEYDVLVYLGHGDLQTVHKDLPPVSQLQFEGSDPAYHDPISSKKLATFLADNPIPAVVLAGCLTAADPAVGTPANLATWMRGNQGMAQAMVNSRSGVLFAVGMRCKVDGSDASKFIAEFFQNLFAQDKGNLELAVRAARRELFGDNPYTSSWAAPMIFSSLPVEPVFKYLTNLPPRGIQITPAISREFDLRRVFWQMLAQFPPLQRPPALINAVEGNRRTLETEVLKQGAMLMADVVDGIPAQPVSVPVALHGPLSCRQIQVKLTAGEGLTLGTPHATEILSNAGFRVLSDAAEPGVFQIQLKENGAAAKALPNGIIVQVDVSVASNASGVCAVNLESLGTDSGQPFWPGNGAVVVPMGV